VSARQGKIVVALAVVVLTALLLAAAVRTSNWVGFAVTEAQLLVPMSISWWMFVREPGGRVDG
jgi:hypothetical protein